MDDKYKPVAVVARIARGKWERTEVGTFLWQAMATGARVLSNTIDDVIDVYQTDAARNTCVERAKESRATVLVMVDADMAPHPAFYGRALEFLLNNRAAVYASPYLAKDGWVNVDEFDEDTFNIRHIDRRDAFEREGIEQVVSCGTGLMAFEMRCFDKLKVPYFYMEYADATCAKMTSTEDVCFTRDCTLAGVPVYVDWECWSGHCKETTLAKPKQGTPRPGSGPFVKADPLKLLLDKLQKESGKNVAECRAALQKTKGAYVGALEALTT